MKGIHAKPLILFAPTVRAQLALISVMAHRHLRRRSTGAKAYVRTASNIISALGLFSFNHPRWTVEKAAQALELGRSTTYRYFKVLADAGFVVATRPGSYTLGPAVTQLDRQARLLDPLIHAARDGVQDLVRLLPTPSVVLLCRLYRDQVMCIYQEPAYTHELTVSYERGKLMPLHRGAASKIILAFLSARFVKAYCDSHGPEMAEVGLGGEWQSVRGALRTLRDDGVAVTQGELDRGVTGVAAPLFDADGNVIGSIGAVLKGDISPDLLRSSRDLVKQYTQMINAELVTELLAD